jgi:hypothetical protein
MSAHSKSHPRYPRNPWSVSDPVQRFNDLTAAKQFVSIRVYFAWRAVALREGGWSDPLRSLELAFHRNALQNVRRWLRLMTGE